MAVTQYRPLDITYPTNYPGSPNIPVPSGLLKDLGVNPLYILESNIKGTRQGWCWTMARTALSTAATSLVPVVSMQNFAGYRNPVTSVAFSDRSTIGLQISGQVASNSALKPVTIAVPFSFSAMEKKSIRVAITGQIFAYSSLHAGAHISVGYIGWDTEDNYFERLPDDFEEACDPNQSPENKIFNRNPAFPLTESTKYFDPIATTTSNIRCFELEIPYRPGEPWPTSGSGFILISILTWPGATVIPGASNLDRVNDWNWLFYGTTGSPPTSGVLDPNHIDLLVNGFGYRDLYAATAGSSQPDTGGKHLRVSGSAALVSLMYKISSPQTGNTTINTPRAFSYHSMMQIRSEGWEGPSKSYSSQRSTNMIYPFLPNDWIDDVQVYSEPGWKLDIFPMSAVNISSIFVDEIPEDRFGTNLYTSDISNYRNEPTTTGAAGSATAYNRNVNDPNTTLLNSPYGASNCNSRVKGNNTIGYLAGVEVLEKNEAFPWSFYDSTETYGLLPVGIYTPLNYSTINFEGWNNGTGYVWMEATTPPRGNILGPDAVYGIDCELDGNPQAINLRVQYPTSAGQSGRPSYDIRQDSSIAYMPFNSLLETPTRRQGISESQFTKAGSFNTPGMLDRYININVLQEYRVTIDLYPMTFVGATYSELYSGFTNNYTTAGAIDPDTINYIWSPVSPPIARIQFLNEGYGPFDLTQRGVLEIINRSSESPGISSLPEGSVYVMYGATYTSQLTQDPT
jgi:hypothetical protein